MKSLSYCILIALAILACTAQPENFYNEDFKWTITIPYDFEAVSASEWERLQHRGLEAMENTVGQEVENQAKIIFVFRNGQLNYLESNYQPFDPEVDGDYRESVKAVNEILYETFRTQLPTATIDSASSTETVSGLLFRTFDVNIVAPNGFKLKTRMYSRLFGTREFSLNMVYADEAAGQKMREAWLKSTFE